MIWPVVVVIAVISVAAGPALWRVRNRSDLPLLMWPVVVAAVALPAFMAWQVLVPGATMEQHRVEKIHDGFELDVPPNTSLLVTGDLSDPDLLPETAEAGKTNFVLSITTEGFSQSCAADVKRKTDGGMNVKATGDQQIGSGTQGQGSRWGEDLQSRCDLNRGGKLTVDVANWHGEAAKGLDISVVPSPFGPPALYGLVAAIIGLALLVETRWGLEKFSGDMAMLALYAVFVRPGTPADAFSDVVGAALPALLIGELVFGGVAWFLVKNKELLDARRESKAEESGAEPSA